MFGELLDRLFALPPVAVYGVIAALAAIENVFPPVPADTAVAVGAFLSSGGHVSAWGVFLVTWVANLLSAGLVYAAARSVGRAFFGGPLGRRLLRRAALARLERWYDRHGVWAIFGSRFLPGVRAVVPPFAGVANLDPVRALAPVAVASALWYGALTFAAATFARNAGAVGDLVSRFNRVVLVVGVLVIAVVVTVVWRRRTAP